MNLRGEICVNAVVTCTNRKSKVVEDCLRLRNFSGKAIKDVLPRWVERLEEKAVDRYPADSLYQGEHWSVAKTIPSIAQKGGFRVRLWVLSAGYGLVRIGSDLRPYSATFSTGSPDSLTRFGPGSTAEWWDRLCRVRELGGSKIRSLEELAAKHKDDPLLIAASEPYLIAIKNDLARATPRLASADLLSVVSAGLRTRPGANGSFLPCDSRFQVYFAEEAPKQGSLIGDNPSLEGGGSKQALNARILQLILKKYLKKGGPTQLKSPALAEWLRTLMEPLPFPKLEKRRTHTDTQVKEWIMENLDTGSRSALHRRFRDEGRACEQTRFKKLHEEVTNQV